VIVSSLMGARVWDMGLQDLRHTWLYKVSRVILDEFKLTGEVAVVAYWGKNRLPGLASGLQDAGAQVVITGTRPKDTDSTIEFVSMDLSNENDLQAMVEHIKAKYGNLDILVNDLSPLFFKPMLEVSSEEWQMTMNSGFKNLFHCIRVVGKYMIANQGGRIVNVISGLAQRGVANCSACCMQMGGVLQLTRTLALEWAEQNVRVNAVGLGWMEDALLEKDRDKVSRYIPMRRLGTPDDVIPLILFLASRASSYMTGYIYFADGGLMTRA
jgi:2-deoxy-D-gluconate 3-dehydrogenase